MKVCILMGSDSDWPILRPAADFLEGVGVETEVVLLQHIVRRLKFMILLAQQVKEALISLLRLLEQQLT